MSLADLEQQRLQVLTPSQRRWVEDHIALGAPDLRQISEDDLKTIFYWPNPDSEDIQVSVASILRSLVWQTWLLVLAGEIEPMHGNLRTFWYRVVEPLCLKHDLLAPEEARSLLSFVQDNAIPELIQEKDLDEPSMLLFNMRDGKVKASYALGAMGRILDHFVRKGFFTFKEPFDFQDPRENFHTIGATRPRIVFFTEKEGLWWLAQEFGRKYGITVMASHGEPGLLTLEYFAGQLHMRGITNPYVGALTDFDPWGYAIADNLKKKLELELETFNFKVDLRRLTSLQLFTPERIAYSKRDLSKVSPNKKAQVDDWWRLTGAHGEKPYGLHVDNAEIPLIRQQVEQWFNEAPRPPRRKPNAGSKPKARPKPAPGGPVPSPPQAPSAPTGGAPAPPLPVEGVPVPSTPQAQVVPGRA